MNSGRKKLLLVLAAVIPLVVCVLLVSGYFAYVAHDYKQRLPVRMDGDWRLAADAQIGFVPANNTSTFRRHIRNDMAYHLYTDDRGARVDQAGLKAPKSVDVLTIGGSYSWGGGVDNEDTFSSIMAEQLGLSVYNVAYGSYGTVQALQMLRKYADLKPKVVVYGFLVDHERRNLSPCAPSYAPFCVPVGYTAFDAQSQPYIHAPVETYDPEAGKAFYEAMITEGFQLQDILWGARIVWGKLKKKAYLEDTLENDTAARRQSMKYLLGEILAETRRMGAKLVVVYIPYVGLVNPNPPSDVFLKAVRAFPRRSNPDLLVVNTQPRVARHYREPKPYFLGFPNDGHPTPLGHLVLADEIIKEMKQQHFVP